MHMKGGKREQVGIAVAACSPAKDVHATAFVCVFAALLEGAEKRGREGGGGVIRERRRREDGQAQVRWPAISPRLFRMETRLWSAARTVADARACFACCCFSDSSFAIE